MAYNPDEPRDQKGQWSAAGGAAGHGGAKTHSSSSRASGDDEKGFAAIKSHLEKQGLYTPASIPVYKDALLEMKAAGTLSADVTAFARRYKIKF